MRRGYSLEEKRKIIIDYIQKNPKATHKDIERETKLHVTRGFKGLEEAFMIAGLKPPRTFKIRTKEEKRKIIIDYIRKNPLVGGQTIAKDTKINPGNVFINIKDAFKQAGVIYPREVDDRKRSQKRKQILQMVQENPLLSIEEIRIKSRTQPYKIFRNIKEIYSEAGIRPVEKRDKWKLKKQQEVIEYIKMNPLATQREINNFCKTHVQLTFKRGIFEAYEKAGVKFPYERLRLYGVGIKSIRDRAKNFEENIAIKLSGYGKVNRLVKTKRGFADIIFERKGQKAIIEVKDYRDKEISISQVNQLNKYLEDSDCNIGFLICHNKPKKHSFLMNKNKIFILDKEELNKIPEIMAGV